MKWDVTFYDEDIQQGYRIAVKRLTVGDGVRIDSEQDVLSQRDDLTGRRLLNMLYYPLLKYGTTTVQVATIDTPPVTDAGDLDLPDEADWQMLDITEEVYLDLSEFLARTWLGAILLRNPQRGNTYEALKKTLSQERPAPAPAAPTSNSASTDSASATT